VLGASPDDVRVSPPPVSTRPIVPRITRLEPLATPSVVEGDRGTRQRSILRTVAIAASSSPWRS
jgi:hypothetical protein